MQDRASKERDEASGYPPPGSQDPHYERQGETAEDHGGHGFGEEGFVAADYPGHNPLRAEEKASYEARLRAAWSGPDRASREQEPVPSNARREEERILREICERLGRMDRSCSDVRIGVHGRTVVLRGSVDDVDARHEIEGVCSTITGVEDVDSELTPRR